MTTLEQFTEQWAPFVWDVDNSTYHADETRLSHSRCKEFRRSRPEFRAVRVEKTKAPKKPSDEMILGNVVDSRVFEADKFSSLYMLADKPNQRSNAGKEEWAAILAEAGSRQVITFEMHNQAVAMVLALQQCPHAADLLWGEGGINQHTICFRDQDSGVACKARLDRYRPGHAVVDLKSTEDPSPATFARLIGNLGYDTQGDWYLRAVDAMHDEALPFVLVVVGREPPYPVGVYELDSQDLARASQKNTRALFDYAECQRTGDWRAGWEREPMTLQLPNYFKYDNQYEV